MNLYRDSRTVRGNPKFDFELPQFYGELKPGMDTFRFVNWKNVSDAVDEFEER
jgi:hypothetical protein